MVQRARRAVVFTGAGMSTECGIPDFRSPGGFWTRYKPIEFNDFMASEETRLEAWRRFLMIRETIGEARPGAGHRAISRAGARAATSRTSSPRTSTGCMRHPGVPRRPDHRDPRQRHLCELPRLRTAPRARLGEGRDRAKGRAPACIGCGGIVKSATISFGQAMPEQEMADARAATLNADLFICASALRCRCFRRRAFRSWPSRTGRRSSSSTASRRDSTALPISWSTPKSGDVLSALLARLAPTSANHLRVGEPAISAAGLESGCRENRLAMLHACNKAIQLVETPVRPNRRVIPIA